MAAKPVRAAAVTVLLILANLLSVPDLARIFGAAFGEYGFSSSDGVVTRITAGDPADRAGLKTGDRIVPIGHTYRQSYRLMRGVAPGAGVPLHLRVIGAGKSRDVTMFSVKEPAAQRALVALRFALAFLTQGVAAVLLLTRPSFAAWGFFLYCMTAISIPGAISSMVWPNAVRNALSVGDIALYSAAPFGGVLFAWTFASQTLTRWRKAIVGGTALAGAAVGACAVAGVQGFFGRDGDAAFYYQLSALFVMLAGFVDSYLHDDPASRQRLKWMIAAMCVTVPAAYFAISLFPLYLSYETYVFLIALQAILPATAAYAMFRKRVVDVRFVISRTFVYGAITAAVAAFFSVLDETLARSYDASRWGVMFDVAIAIAIGFSLDTIRERIDSVIDRVLFRDRHEAEKRLKAAASAIVHATGPGVVHATLAHLPVAALQLRSGASYEFDGRVYACKDAAGGAGSMPPFFEENDLLVLSLKAERRPQSGHDIAHRRHAHSAIHLAAPMMARGELLGFAVFDAHKNGLEFDRDEIALIETLAQSGASALDHIETKKLRERVAQLEGLLGPAAV